MQNLEIKARLREREAMEHKLRALGAIHEASLFQVDTYFSAPGGRLKLRQASGEDDTLIFYRRPDRDAPKLSDYQLVTVAGGQDMAEMLTQALGVRVVVRKRRDLWRLENVRIHLDEVEGLGSYLEFEAQVTADRDPAFCLRQSRDLMRALDVAEMDLVAGSYSDLLLAAASQ